MLTDNLFEQVLIEPFEQYSSLYIVSGYASATMVSRHFRTLIRDNRRRNGFIRRKDVRIELIVGMAVHDGISKHDHEGFQEIAHEYDGLFECRYVVYAPPVHSKAFAWYDASGAPISGFAGSANYTQSAFGRSRREVMVECDAEAIHDYFGIVRQDTIDCMDPHVDNHIEIYDRQPDELAVDENTGEISDKLAELPHAKVSLLNRRTGQVHEVSGLNWGQRPGRDPDQAYISIPAGVYNTDFFPPRGEHFTIITDDDKSLICVRRQDNGKAIHTPDKNSRMGEYFRNRIGMPSGSFVKREDLERYGRTDVDFYKIDEETYRMDFSV